MFCQKFCDIMTNKMKARKFSSEDVKRIAQLANIPVVSEEETTLADGFNKTLATVDRLLKVKVRNIEPTHQVTGSENVMREDEVEVERMFTQEQALSNAPRTHNGFFVVGQILEE